MKEQEVISVLSKWRDLLKQYSLIEIDLNLEPETIKERFSERQQNIDAIQHLDAQLKRIIEIRADGWGLFSQETINMAEALIDEGRAICDRSVSSDRKTLDIAGQARRDISVKLTNVRRSKHYLPSRQMTKHRPAIIVDEHA